MGGSLHYLKPGKHVYIFVNIFIYKSYLRDKSLNEIKQFHIKSDVHNLDLKVHKGTGRLDLSKPLTIN